MVDFFSWIEGGKGPGGLITTTYCAPKKVSCSGKKWNQVKVQNPNYPNVASEQDWQGAAHNLIGVCLFMVSLLTLFVNSNMII